MSRTNIFLPFTTAIFFAVVLQVTSQSDQHPVVNTKYGKVRGLKNEAGSLSKFQGIPFAKPPVGSLRLMKPTPPERWSETLDALHYKPSCEEVVQMYGLMQDEFKVFPTYQRSEDCLYLNVFVPGDLDTKVKLPVMVYIYGGGNGIGNANSYPGDVLSEVGGVVIVTFNYRVGLFGFAASDDGVIPGNMGLFDQHLAIRWVNENIEEFGGDASKVTIFGESAGADSVLSHLASPLSGNLFQGVLSQSPAAIKRLKSRSDQYAKLLHISQPVCGTPENSKALLACLQALSVEEFGGLLSNFWFNYEYVVIDGEFLPEDPSDIFKKGDFDKSKVVTLGYNGDDGDIILRMMSNWTSLVREGIDANQVTQLAPVAFSMFFGLSPQQMMNLPLVGVMLDLLNREYFKGLTNPLDLARSVIDLYTDAFFASTCFEVADLVSGHGGKVFIYKYNHLTESKHALMKPNMEVFAGHGEEVFYEFYATVYDSRKTGGITITESERSLSRALMKTFAQLAKSQ